MKLYLSSYHLGDNPEILASLFSENKKVAVITNALDFSDDFERREKSIEQYKELLLSIGLHPEELDLRKYFSREKNLSIKLKEYGGVWARGGNVFTLRRAMKESGFDKILFEKQNERDFVYGGFSAGVCVLAPSLRGLELVDDPHLAPDDYPNTDIIWEGLGILDY